MPGWVRRRLWELADGGVDAGEKLLAGTPAPSSTAGRRFAVFEERGEEVQGRTSGCRSRLHGGGCLDGLLRF